jgi:hypothetical protein
MPTIAPLTYPIDGRAGQLNKLSGRGKSFATVREQNLRGVEPNPYAPSSNVLYYVSSAFTVDYVPCAVICDANSAAFSITLPSAASCYGRYIDVIKSDSTVNAITFTATSPDIISYNTAWVGLTKQWETCSVLATVDSSGQGRWIIMMSRTV